MLSATNSAWCFKGSCNNTTTAIIYHYLQTWKTQHKAKSVCFHTKINSYNYAKANTLLASNDKYLYINRSYMYM